MLTPGGGLVAARDISISGGLENAGNLLAQNTLEVSGAEINNLGGSIAGKMVSLAALNDLNNIGGSIVGQSLVNLEAGGSVNLAAKTVNTSVVNDGQFSNRTMIDQAAVVAVTGPEGLLVIEAGGDVNLKAARVNSAGSAAVLAGNDINLGGLEVSFEQKTSLNDPKNMMRLRETEEVGSQVKAQGDLLLAAGRDLNVTGSQVYSDGDLTAQAGRDLTITEGRSAYYSEVNLYYANNKIGSQKSTRERLLDNADKAIASDLSGNAATITAGNNFTLRGSSLAASEGLSISAGGGVNISGAENFYESERCKVTKRSDLTGGLSGGRVSLGYGQSEKGRESADESYWHSASLAGSENGLVSVYAGLETTISGSQVIAGTGDLVISGQNVTIDSQFDTYDHSDRQWTKQSGLTLSIGLSGAVGAAINAASQLSDQARAAKEAKSDRAAALYGLAAARGVYDLGQGIMGLPGAFAQDAANAGGGNPTSNAVGVSVSLGYSSGKTENKYESHDTVVSGSYITSGGSAAIAARGDESGRGGDLNIIGSLISADSRVFLTANNDLNLISAEELSAFKSSNKSSGGGVSVSYGFGTSGGGWGGSASYSQSQGRGQGESLSYVETIISGGQGVEFSSGRDTLMKGARIYGETIIGRVGGNLSIISEQDTARQSFKQSSMGAGVSVDSGGNGASFSVSKQSASGAYASVNEQSGLFAGEGGFEITVGGQTALVGAVIDSEAQAAKNSLVTGSLSVEDIHNQSGYSAKSSGFGAEIGGKSSLSPSLPLKESGQDSSETRSAIAAGNVTITDLAAQMERTGQTAEQVLASLNRDTANAHPGSVEALPDLQKIMDKQAEIADAAGQAGRAVAITVGDIAKSFTKDYEIVKAAEEDAKRVLNSIEASQEEKDLAGQSLEAIEKYWSENPGVIADYEKWSEGGLYKVVLQAAGSALVAQIGNGEGLNAALGAAASQLAAGQIGDFAHTVARSMTEDAARQFVIADLISNVVSSGLGLAAGGESGSNAAAAMNRYNRQLHPDEIRWIKGHAEDFIDLACATEGLCGRDALTEDQAISILARQALRNVDAWWQAVLAPTERQLADNDYMLTRLLAAADSFLKVVGGKNSFNTYDLMENPLPQAFFTAENGQFSNPVIFADFYKNQTSQEYLNFYRGYVHSGIVDNGQLYKKVLDYYGQKAKDTLRGIIENPLIIIIGSTRALGEALGDAGFDLQKDPSGTLTGWGDSLRAQAGGASERFSWQFSTEGRDFLGVLYYDKDAGDLLVHINNATVALAFASSLPIGKVVSAGVKEAYSAAAAVARGVAKGSSISDPVNIKLHVGQQEKKHTGHA